MIWHKWVFFCVCYFLKEWQSYLWTGTWASERLVTPETPEWPHNAENLWSCLEGDLMSQAEPSGLCLYRSISWILPPELQLHFCGLNSFWNNTQPTLRHIQNVLCAARGNDGWNLSFPRPGCKGDSRGICVNLVFLPYQSIYLRRKNLIPTLEFYN